MCRYYKLTTFPLFSLLFLFNFPLSPLKLDLLSPAITLFLFCCVELVIIYCVLGIFEIAV